MKKIITKEELKKIVENNKYFGFLGKANFDESGLIICHICGKSFDRLPMHLRQSHGLSTYDYKEAFGLNICTGLISLQQKELMRKYSKENYDKVIKENLIKNGEKTRFEKGSSGRTKEKVRIGFNIQMKESHEKFKKNK